MTTAHVSSVSAITIASATLGLVRFTKRTEKKGLG